MLVPDGGSDLRFGSEAVHAGDHRSRGGDGGGSSRGRECVEPEPRGPERCHLREVRASDQPRRYGEPPPPPPV